MKTAAWDVNIINSLPWAINQSNNTPGLDTIQFDFTVNGLGAGAALLKSDNTVLVSDPVWISGPAPGAGNSVTITGVRPLVFNPPSNAVDGETPPPPQASKVSLVTFDQCNNKAAGVLGADGGAVQVSGGEVEFHACRFTNNASGRAGGAIDIGGGATVRLTGFGGFVGAGANPTLFQNNNAEGSGGAVSNGGTLIIGLGLFTSNNAKEGNGGAIESFGVVTASGAWFTGNTAKNGHGGAVCINSNSQTASKFTGLTVSISDNIAATGGGIAVLDGSLKLDTVSIRNNTATDNGGGLFVENATVEAKSVEFGGNTAVLDPATNKSKGSAVDIASGGKLVSEGCVFNAGGAVGGIRVFAAAPGQPAGVWQDSATNPSVGWVPQ